MNYRKILSRIALSAWSTIAVILVMWSFALHPAEADSLFYPAVNYGVGDQPYTVAIGDLNGDGAPNLALANEWSDNVSVFINYKTNLIWKDEVDGTRGKKEWARAVAVKGNRVFVGGCLNKTGCDLDFTLRAYHAKKGKFLWQEQFDGTAGAKDSARSIAVDGSRVFVAGAVENTNRETDFTVRAYDNKTGKLLWQDQYNGTANGRDEVGGKEGVDKYAIAVKKNRVFVTGRVENSDTREDFTVRAYKAK